MAYHRSSLAVAQSTSEDCDFRANKLLTCNSAAVPTGLFILTPCEKYGQSCLFLFFFYLNGKRVL